MGPLLRPDQRGEGLAENEKPGSEESGSGIYSYFLELSQVESENVSRTFENSGKRGRE